MNQDQAGDAVRRALLEVVPAEDLDGLDPDAVLRDDLEMDSLDFLSFVESLSAQTGVRIDEDDYPRLVSLTSCAAFLAGAAATP